MNDTEKFAYLNLVNQVPCNLFRNGFMGGLREKELLNGYAGDDTDPHREHTDKVYLSVRPDAFFFNDEEKEIVVFEIEDTSSLTIEKISKYYNMSEEIFDSHHWRLTVIVTDRYGLNWREIPLDAYELVDNWEAFNKRGHFTLQKHNQKSKNRQRHRDSVGRYRR